MPDFEPMLIDPEPNFIIRAKDNLSVSAVLSYRDLCVSNGLDEQAKQVDRAIEEIIDWRARNPTLVKDPDHIHIPLIRMPVSWQQGEAMTPIKEIVRRGLEIYTIDMADGEELVCTAPDERKAEWLHASLVAYHLPQRGEPKVSDE